MYCYLVDYMYTDEIFKGSSYYGGVLTDVIYAESLREALDLFDKSQYVDYVVLNVFFSHVVD